MTRGTVTLWASSVCAMRALARHGRALGASGHVDAGVCTHEGKWMGGTGADGCGEVRGECQGCRGAQIALTPEHFQDMSDDNLEEGSSSIPVESHTEENVDPDDEDNDHANPEAFSIDPRSFDDDTSDTAESNHDDDADRVAFVDAAAEKANVQPSERSPGGFADEDDLYDLYVSSTAPRFSLYFRTVISTLEAVTSQFTSLEADKVRLQKEVESTFSKLDNSVKMVVEACQNADSLKEELEWLRNKLKDEEALKTAAEAQRSEKDNFLRQSILALLKAADIPADALDKLPNDSPVDDLSMTLESSKLIQALVQKNKGVMSRMHLMIFSKADQNKILEQLTDAFVVDTKEIIEVFKCTSHAYDALLAFQLMMGHGFKADMEQMSKELTKEQDGQLIDLSLYKSSARKCVLQLLELVSANKHPSADLMAIANADDDVGHLFAKAHIPATIVIERLEDSTKAVEEAKIPEEES
ncbi:hypothetical protein QYE76_044712 [Lolium multiflorum]|uniref:Uncharacterized protein n=1 Tax=Lolium multiflorum TaxID=4521 RepID=A0AAD8TLI0_LOLMU|nr:hypothetical protein QYE76_044712 [Lolium multiflorum]